MNLLPPTEQVPLRDTNAPAEPARTTRRQVLRRIGGAGAVIAIVAVGAGGLRAYDQGVFATGDGPAYAAWNDWPGALGEPENLIEAAILASNAHNSQPWLFRLDPA